MWSSLVIVNTNASNHKTSWLFFCFKSLMLENSWEKFLELIYFKVLTLAFRLSKIYTHFTLQVFEFLIRLHSAEAPTDEEVYPYVRTLLHFDTREFLNVLALVSRNTNCKDRKSHYLLHQLKQWWIMFRQLKSNYYFLGLRIMVGILS